VTATDIRSSRAGFAITPFLPLVLILLMLGVAVLIAQVAPSRVTTGVYQVFVGPDPYEAVRIPTEHLTCTRSERIATCTTPPIAGAPIKTMVTYRERPDPPLSNSSCVARHGDRSVSCMSTMGDYGHASQWVYIQEDLGISAAERARLRDAVPWWRLGDQLGNRGLLLIGLLTLAAGISGYLLGGRATRWARRRQWPITIGTGLLALATVAVGGLIITPNPAAGGVHWLLPIIHPITLGVAVGLAGWQYQLCGDERIRRARYAVGAAVATACYTAAALFIFLWASAFID
jgi:hypothetical protein